MVPEHGPRRSADELSSLTPEMTAPIVPEELAQTHTSNVLRGYAMGEFAKAEGLRRQAAELQAQLDLVNAGIESADIRRGQYMKAAELARAIEDGK